MSYLIIVAEIKSTHNLKAILIKTVYLGLNRTRFLSKLINLEKNLLNSLKVIYIT